MKKADQILKKLRIYEAFDPLGKEIPKATFQDALKQLESSDNYKITGYDDYYKVIKINSKDHGNLILSKVIGSDDDSWVVAKKSQNGKDFKIWKHGENAGFKDVPQTDITSKKYKNLQSYINNIESKQTINQYGNEPKTIIDTINSQRDVNKLLNDLNSTKVLKVNNKSYKVVDLSKNKSAYTITKDQEKFYVICRDKDSKGVTTWNIAIPDEKSQSDYLYYDKNENKFVKANGQIKKENPNLTNYIRNKNFKTEIKDKAKQTAKDTAEGAGKIIGSIVGGPLGGYLGSKVGSWAGDKFFG